MENIWFPFYQAQLDGAPIEIKKAEGVLLFDQNNRSLIDINSSWWVNVHGHGRAEIRDAISRQFDQIDHVIFSGVTHQAAEDLSKNIIQLLGEKFNKVFFSDDGSTAVEVALKMSVQYYSNQNIPKKKFVALEGAYHGDTFGAMSTGQRGYFNKPFEPYFFDVEFLPFPSSEQWESCLAKAKEIAGSKDVVAFIVEPLIQGSAGMQMYQSQYLDELVRIFRNSGALIIFDEIMTAWGRLGEYFAMNLCEEKPDIVCLSKGLTGGVLPLGLTVATQDVFHVFDQPDKSKALLHGHSFTGNPLSCAAALASLKIFSEEETWLNIQRISSKMKSFVSYLEDNKIYHNPRCLGTIFAVDLIQNDGYFAAIRNQIYTHFIQNGVLCRPLGATVFFNPPYVITDEQLDYAFDLLLALREKIKP